MVLLTAESPVPSLAQRGCSMNIYWIKENTLQMRKQT